MHMTHITYYGLFGIRGLVPSQNRLHARTCTKHGLCNHPQILARLRLPAQSLTWNPFRSPFHDIKGTLTLALSIQEGSPCWLSFQNVS